jgi:hypothetical protein
VSCFCNTFARPQFAGTRDAVSDAEDCGAQ